MGTIAARRAFERHQDVLIALVMLVLGEWQVAAGADGAGDPAVAAPAVVVYCAALGFRRTQAFPAVAAVAACWVISALLGSPPSSIWALVLVLVLSYSAAAYEIGRQATAGLVLLLVAAYASTWLTPGSEFGDRLFTAPVLVGAPWAAGLLARRFREQAQQLAVLNAVLEERRVEEVEDAARRERTRIARELHDVVSHGLGMITVQAGAALKVLDVDPARARYPLEDIRTQGKEALADMRTMLGVLVEEELGLPSRGLHDLPELFNRLRAVGVSVAYDGVEASFPALTDEEAFVVYRVVQESVTNALKHGSVRHLRVRLHGDAAGGHVEVDDDGGTGAGTGVGTDAGAGESGHGLASMRARAAHVGGRIDARPRDFGGWRVALTLPRDPRPDGAAPAGPSIGIGAP
jgi:signal transduction histidine kinase